MATFGGVSFPEAGGYLSGIGPEARVTKGMCDLGERAGREAHPTGPTEQMETVRKAGPGRPRHNDEVSGEETSQADYSGSAGGSATVAACSVSARLRFALRR